jgi:PAS domain S-box-containing protein
MVLTDRLGRVIHVNTAWSQLTGYELAEVEGRTCKFLQGRETNFHETVKSKEAVRQNRPFQMTVVNYKKNGERFLNKVIIVPIHGGYEDPSKFISLFFFLVYFC